MQNKMSNASQVEFGRQRLKERERGERCTAQPRVAAMLVAHVFSQGARSFLATAMEKYGGRGGRHAMGERGRERRLMEGGRGSGSGDDVMSGEMESALAEGRNEGLARPRSNCPGHQTLHTQLADFRNNG